MFATVVWIFWLSVFLVVYPYVLYPLFLVIANRFKAQKTQGVDRSGTPPSITLIVSAFNEEAVIERKLENALSLDYPSEAFEIIVVSDGSTDSTDEIVHLASKKDPRIRLVRLDSQSGKTLGLNKAVPLAKGDIVVFSDANALYQRDALARLVQPFADERVGYTVGSALYREEDIEAVNVSEGMYWKYELWIKKLESCFHSVVGGDGAIYAIRRKLYRELSGIDISDFVNPLQIIASGYRGVFLEDARSYEGGTDEFSDEFRRKRRIVNRSWGAVRRHISIFSLARDKRFLFMLISHKVIRWWSCAFVSVALISGVILALGTSSAIYFLLSLGIALTIAVGVIGWRRDTLGKPMPKLVYLLYYFYLVGFASLLGIADDLRGHTYATWKHVR